jgi:hypothetical protein
VSHCCQLPANAVATCEACTSRCTPAGSGGQGRGRRLRMLKIQERIRFYRAERSCNESIHTSTSGYGLHCNSSP